MHKDRASGFMKENSYNPSTNCSFKALMKISIEGLTIVSGYIYYTSLPIKIQHVRNLITDFYLIFKGHSLLIYSKKGLLQDTRRRK